MADGSLPHFTSRLPVDFGSWPTSPHYFDRACIVLEKVSLFRKPFTAESKSHIRCILGLGSVLDHDHHYIVLSIETNLWADGWTKTACSLVIPRRFSHDPCIPAKLINLIIFSAGKNKNALFFSNFQSTTEQRICMMCRGARFLWPSLWIDVDSEEFWSVVRNPIH